MFSCIFSCISLGIFGTSQIGIFDDSSHFFWNWSLDFVPIMLYTWSMMFNWINLVFCETLKILGLVFIRIWGFCSNWFQLIKLAYWICIFYLVWWSVGQFLQIEQVVFPIFGFLLETLCSSQFYEFELKFMALEHASWHI